MMKTIYTKNGNYNFQPVNLYHGRKKIDKEIAQENLLILRGVLANTDIRWGLIFGTLLGAIRENDFIAHDEDTDVYIFEEDRQKCVDILWELKKCGFEVARYENALLSIIRKNEYIDFYFFKKGLFGRRSDGYYVPRIHFSSTESIKLFHFDFPTLYKPNSYLEYTYGKDWKIPKINSHAVAKPVLWKRAVKKMFPFLYRKYRR